MFRLVKSFEVRLGTHIDARNSNVLGALGEKLFLEHVVPEMCRDCDIAVNNLTALKSIDRALPTYPLYPVCRLAEGKIAECFSIDRAIMIPRDASIMSVDIYLEILINAGIAIRYRKQGEPYERKQGLSIAVSSSVAERISKVIRFAEGIEDVATELRSYVVEKLFREAIYFEELDLMGIHFDFVCARSSAVNKELDVDVAVKLCSSSQPVLDDSRCSEVHRHSTRIHVPVTALVNAKIFEVKTSLEHRKIDRPSLRKLFNFKSVKDVERYFSYVKKVLSQYGARYFAVLVTPVPLYSKAIVSVYELH